MFLSDQCFVILMRMAPYVSTCFFDIIRFCFCILLTKILGRTIINEDISLYVSLTILFPRILIFFIRKTKSNRVWEKHDNVEALLNSSLKITIVTKRPHLYQYMNPNAAYDISSAMLSTFMLSKIIVNVFVDVNCKFGSLKIRFV